MTPEQRTAVRILAGCRMYSRRDRELAKALEHLADTEPRAEIGGWYALRLQEMLHKYRRQHGRCPCLQCLETRLGNPHQRSLFPEESERCSD